MIEDPCFWCSQFFGDDSKNQFLLTTPKEAILSTRKSELMSNAYETMYILRPDLGEELLDQTIERYQTMLLEAGATNIEIQHRGKRRLAYEISRQREGIYIQMNYEGDGSFVAPMERAMRQSDEVIRYLTIKQEINTTSEADNEAVA